MPKKIITVIILIITLTGNVYAYNENEFRYIYNSTLTYLYNTVTSPAVSSIGGEWAVLGIARSGADIPDEWYNTYYNNAAKYIKENNGVLHNKKYTEYSRCILALTAIGKNPQNISGYNLLKPLGDYEKTIWQGLNGPIWALIALDSANYNIPSNPDAAVQATRDMYIKYILSMQNTDGGWALNSNDNNGSDVDITAMSLCALAKYTDRANVKSAVEKALSFLSDMQNNNGGFESYGTENAESSAQVITALCALGIPAGDLRFTKSNINVLDNMLTYYKNGGFCHILNDGINQMATEQCFYALVALKRFNEGKTFLYDMSDVNITSDTNNTGSIKNGLAEKNKDIKINSKKSVKEFTDVQNSSAKDEIQVLSSYGIINGKTDTEFKPFDTMTRAEFAAITVRALGLINKSSLKFEDVKTSDWYYDYISIAYNYGIITGESQNIFNPNGLITKQEAAVMIQRTAKLCGLNTVYTNDLTRDILSAYTDYTTVSDWAKQSLAFCYDNKILPDTDMEINPFKNVTREEIAYMLFNMLSAVQLI